MHVNHRPVANFLSIVFGESLSLNSVVVSREQMGKYSDIVERRTLGPFGVSHGTLFQERYLKYSMQRDK